MSAPTDIDAAALLRQRAWVEVDLEAIASNVRTLRRTLTPSTELMAVVKADAYGHGALAVARTVLAAGATRLCVATLMEAMELRQAGIGAPILLLGATHSADQARAAAQWRIEPTLSTVDEARVFSRLLAEQGRELPVHLKLDTGMARLGAPWEDAVAFHRAVQALPGLRIDSLYSHLATADELDQTILRQQQQRFEAAIAAVRTAGLPCPRLHLANSAAAIAFPELHYDAVRVGLALYGVYPAPHLRRRLDLKPALQVRARVTHVRHLPAGTGVSYGHRFITPHPTRMAVIGIGYADGILRSLSNRMQVLAQGQRLAQIGMITMDQLMVDATVVPTLQPGDVVTLLGDEGTERITADDWALQAGTIPWEVLCGFRQRLPRWSSGVHSPQLREHSR